VKYLSEFRDEELARRLLADIRRVCTRRWTMMEVCGGQTHSLLRYGIESDLADCIELLHGPGCPVCVTPAEAIDLACELAQRPGFIVASFGDMLRVPGNRGSLQQARASGGRVQPVYSPLDAVTLARQHPEKEVVFFAVGFETTSPATALAVLQADRHDLTNFSLLVAHVRVLPAMEQIVSAPPCRVQGFLAAGHVCTIVGCEPYRPFLQKFGVPVVVTGFEPLDLLAGIRECVQQLEGGRAELSNQYARSVTQSGNLPAQQLVAQVYEVCDRPWRGLGVIPAGGLRLQRRWHRFDAEQRFPAHAARGICDTDCPSGDILRGRIKPPQCPHFGTHCTPDRPLGAPMVSSEGACAAYFHYRQPAAAIAAEVGE
jgi:hydrogenase expression/formation protein HypD